jgi:hypothetical protein
MPSISGLSVSRTSTRSHFAVLCQQPDNASRAEVIAPRVIALAFE